MSGRAVDDQRCFCCGTDNPQGLHLRFGYPAEGRAETQVRIPEYFSGWQEITHGGFLAMILDEAMAHACLSTGRMGMTAEMQIRFLRPAMVGDTVRVFAQLAGTRGRLADAWGVICDQAGVELARGTGRFVMAREDR
ncbi:MAG: PaaI family thioesterase [Spirochaetales bacterium]|nr:PaaI family thioesterase [Spirochaetales bacterium]